MFCLSTLPRLVTPFCFVGWYFRSSKLKKSFLLQSESVNRFIKACCKNKQWSEGRRLKLITLIKYVLAKFQDFLNPKSLLFRFKSCKILNSKKFEEQQKKMKENYDWDYAGLAKLSGVSFTEAVKKFYNLFWWRSFCSDFKSWESVENSPSIIWQK